MAKGFKRNIPAEIVALQICMIPTILVLLLLLVLAPTEARALPAFAEQVGVPCSMCHVGGFGPQLTTFGREFKLGGYTLRASPGFTMPFAAMMIDSYVNTRKDQAPPPAPHYGPNDNATIDQVSIFAAGGFGGHFGGFSQLTYDGIGRAFTWDNLDLRMVDRTTIGGTNLLYGVSLNNNPGVQDVWNTLPTWGFPYTDSALAPSPQAATILSGGLAQRVLGASAYAWWDSRFYIEAGAYWNPGRSFLRAVGVDILDGGAALSGGSPFLRIAYQRDYGNQNFEIGASGLWSNLNPGGMTSVATDRYADITVDASWQFIGSAEHIVQVNGRYTHEQQDLGGSFVLGNAANAHNELNELHLDISYYWHRKLGFTVSPFDIWGSRDALLYAANRTETPDSAGVLFQVDYTFWGTDASPLGPRLNLRVGAQYRAYTRFNGAGKDYDGLGTNAPDNNTFRLFTWLAF